MGISVALLLGKRCRTRIDTVLSAIAGVILLGMRGTKFAIAALEPARDPVCDARGSRVSQN